MYRIFVAALVLVVFAALAPAVAQAAPVVTNTNDSGPGSLRQAAIDAASGDTVTFAPALSGQTITLTSGLIMITKNLSIQGPTGGISISGNDASRIFTVQPGVNAQLYDLTLTNGAANEGGGIFNGVGSTLSLTRVRITNSHASSKGGALFNNGGSGGTEYGGTVTVRDSRFDSNSAFKGGAIFNDGGLFESSAGGTLLIDGSTLDHNHADDDGGAVYNLGGLYDSSTGGVTTIIRSSLTSNYSNYEGGAIAAEIFGYEGVTGGSVSVIESEMTANRSGGGGAIGIFGSELLGAYPIELKVSKSSLYGNSASGGGAIALFDEGSGDPDFAPIGNIDISDSTLSNNTADVVGGAIYVNTGTHRITNSTGSGNSAFYGGFALAAPDSRSMTSMDIVFSTITKNSSNTSALAASFEADYPSPPNTIRLTNSIVADQTSGSDCFTSPGITSGGFNLDSDGSCGLNSSGDNPNAEARLEPLALNPPGTTKTHALGTDSDAYDRIPYGVNGCGTTTTTDQRGVTRPQQLCEIGAYELECATDPCAPAAVGGAVELAVAVGTSGNGVPPVVMVVGLALGTIGLATAGWRLRRRV